MVERQGNILSRIFSDMHFDQYFHPIVVVANAKTILNVKYAKKEVKDKIIRGDQLIEYIRKRIINSDTIARSYGDLSSLAEMFLDHHHAKRIDVRAKYAEWLTKKEVNVVEDVKTSPTEVKISENGNSSVEDLPVYLALKNYRLLKSREEGIKAFYIYSNAQLEALVIALPKNKEALIKISGFNHVKCEKYGQEIIDIILQHI